MIVFFFVWIFSIIVGVESYEYPCQNPGDEIHSVSPTVDANYEELCYHYYGDMNHHSRDAFLYCQQNFHKDSVPPTFHEVGELNYVVSKLGGTAGAWIGFYKGYFFNCAGSGGDEDNPAKYFFTDGTSTTWLINTWKPANEFICQNSVQTFCFYMGADGRIRDQYCSRRTNNYVTMCKYKIPKCGTMNAYTAGVCNGHGSCVAWDTCECDFYYSGSNCELTHKCGSFYWTDKVNVCSGRGNCTSEDSCLCETGYYGAECEKTVPLKCTEAGVARYGDGCYYDFGTGNSSLAAEEFCTNWKETAHSISISSYGEESFLKTNFGTTLNLGLRKHPRNVDEEWILHPCTALSHGYYWTDSKSDVYARAKGSRVVCESDFWCIGMKNEYFWNDVDCEVNYGLKTVCRIDNPNCFGIYASDPTQCNQRGTCDTDDSCTCFNGFYGDNCERWDCFGLRSDYKTKWESVCSGHGSCVGPNACICEANYGSVDCSATYCNNILSTNIGMVCSGHGDCTSHDTCTCDWDYGGQWCNLPHARPGVVGATQPGVGAKVKPWTTHPLENGNVPASLLQVTEIKSSVYWHEDHCFNNWIPTKGHLMSIHSIEQFREVNDLRCLYPHTSSDDDFSLYMGIKKVHANPPYGDCINGYYHTDGTEAAWLVTRGFYSLEQGWVNYNPTFCLVCNSDSQSFRSYYLCSGSNEWQNINDQEGVVLGQGLCQYKLHWCHGTREDSVDVCNGNGFCWAYNTCTCKGPVGYFGNECNVVNCYGTNSNETRVCSGHGLCLESEVCQCQKGWYGQTCNVTACFGTFTNETAEAGSGLQENLACAGHGECYEEDTCRCESSKYTGANCDVTYCNYVKSDTNASCSGHGVCWPYDTCDCQKEDGYGGEYCDEVICYGVISSSAEVCSGGGNCVDIEKCECIADKYWTEQCNITKCNGIFSNDTANVCSGVGKCWPYETCQCEDPLLVGYCDAYKCFNVHQNDPSVCNGKGNCYGGNKCNCTGKFIGEKCDVTTCYGVLSNESASKVCFGKGVCKDYNNCTCVTGHSGWNCNYTTCNGIGNDQWGVCEGRGTCDLLDQCVCNVYGYDPASYCKGPLCFAVSALATTSVCAGHGVCEAIDICNCSRSNGYYGLACKEYFSQVKGMIAFRFDFLFLRRTITLPYQVIPSVVTGHANAYKPNKPYACNTLFNTIKKDGVDAFAQFKSCRFVGAPGDRRASTKNIEHIELQFVDDDTGATSISEGEIFEFDFKLLQPNPNFENNYVYTWSANVNETTVGQSEEYPYDDRNNQPEEPEDTDDDGSSTSSANKITITEGESSDAALGIVTGLLSILSGGVIAVSVTVVIVVVLVVAVTLYCVVACCCCCCCCSCFVYYCCKCFGGGGDGDLDDDIAYQMKEKFVH